MGDAKGGTMNKTNYKLPTDIERRFDEKFTYSTQDGSWLDANPSDIKYHVATEQVTLLEWMLGEIGEDEKTGFYSSYELCKCGNKPIDIYCEKCGRKSKIEVRKYETDDDSTRNQLRAELRAKVLSKIEEYKV